MEEFHASFFQAKQEMRKKFLELQQEDQTVDAYATDFVRLGCFALTLLVDEEERAHMFYQGLWYHLRKHLVGHNFKTYSELFEVACFLEQVTKEGRSMAFKRPLIKG